MTIAFVRQAVGSSSASNTVAATITAPAAGNALVAMIGSNSASMTTVTGGGVTWALLIKGNFASFDCEIWYGLSSSGSGTTITATLSGGATGENEINVSEWSGVAAADTVTAKSNGPAANPSVGPITATRGDALYLSNLVLQQNGTTGPGDSFIALTDASNSFRHALGAYRIDTTPASATPSWTQASGSYDMVVGALLGALPAARFDPMGMMGFFG